MQWRTVFWIAFGVFMVTNLAYILWASGETQPWNTPHLMNKTIEGAENAAYEDPEEILKAKRKNSLIIE